MRYKKLVNGHKSQQDPLVRLHEVATIGLTADNIEAVADALADRLNRDTSPWLTTEGAAAYIGSTRNTLKTYRARGKGPPFHRVSGRLVRYRRDELDAWLRSGG